MTGCMQRVTSTNQIESSGNCRCGSARRAEQCCLITGRADNRRTRAASPAARRRRSDVPERQPQHATCAALSPEAILFDLLCIDVCKQDENQKGKINHETLCLMYDNPGQVRLWYEFESLKLVAFKRWVVCVGNTNGAVKSEGSWRTNGRVNGKLHFSGVCSPEQTRRKSQKSITGRILGVPLPLSGVMKSGHASRQNRTFHNLTLAPLGDMSSKYYRRTSLSATRQL